MAQLLIRPVDPLPKRDGFPLNHPYVEHVYAGVVGPTSVLILRRADLLFRVFPEGIEIDPGEFGQSLGLGASGDRHSVLGRTFARLDRFRLARWDPAANTLAVPREVPPVGSRLLERLPASTQAVHRSLLSSLRGHQVDAGRPLVDQGASVGSPGAGAGSHRVTARRVMPPAPATPTVGLGIGR